MGPFWVVLQRVGGGCLVAGKMVERRWGSGGYSLEKCGCCGIVRGGEIVVVGV